MSCAWTRNSCMRAPFFALLLSALAAIPASAAEMPKDFVYLSDVDPSIEQDMRYAGADNFTGRPVPGYDAPECVLVRQAAEALKAVQAEVKAKGLLLKVYDCYRPAEAVAAFVAWSKAPDDPDSKATIRPSPRRSCFRKATSPRSRATRAAPPWTSRWFCSTQIRFNPRPAGMLSAPARRRRRCVKPTPASTWALASTASMRRQTRRSPASASRSSKTAKSWSTPWRATASRTTTRNGGTLRSRTSLIPTRCSISRSSREGRSHRTSRPKDVDGRDRPDHDEKS